MADSRISLDGTWEFLHISDDRLAGPAEVRQIVVPAPWQAQFADLRMRAGIGIYRRHIDIPQEWLRDCVWLRFGAVFHNVRVFVNGELAGTNEGGFLPFSFEVTRHLRPGVNEIKVRVARSLLEQGRMLPVLTSATVVGAERSRALFEEAYAEYARRVSKVLQDGASQTRGANIGERQAS